jgi:hypothetical protein
MASPSPLNPPSNPSKPSKSTKSNLLPSRKDDSNCFNCLGIAVYNEKLKIIGKRPQCYGLVIL